MTMEKSPYHYYTCYRRFHHGEHVCSNPMRARAEQIDEAVLIAIEEHGAPA
jgi:hypothetical protein